VKIITPTLRAKATYYKLLFTSIPCMGFLPLPLLGRRVKGHVSIFVLASGLAPKDLLEGLGESFVLEVSEDPQEILTYRDTFDWRLYTAGLTLTTSQTGRKWRATVRTQDGRVEETKARKNPSFATDLPPGPLAELLRSTAKHRRLLPRARISGTRTLISILDSEGKAAVRLLLRQGTAVPTSGQGQFPLLPRLEFKPLKGHRAEEKEVTKFLRKRFQLKRDKRTELEVVCDAIGQTPGDHPSSVRLELNSDMAAAEATRLIHRLLLQTMLANQEGVIRDWDSEFLHDFRVAARKTRSALSQMKGMFPKSTVDHFTEEFQWLGSKMGPARDMDVYLFNIPTYEAALPAEARDNLEPLIRLLLEKRRVEHRRLRRCLRSKRYARLMEEWRAFLDQPGAPDPPPSGAHRPVREVASEKIWKAYNKVLKTGGRISRKSPPEALHRLRIQCKKLRYLITFFRSLYPQEALSPIIGGLKGLQDHLGDFNDLQVQREALRGFAEEIMATESGPPATLLAMGQLMGQLEGKQTRVREAFDESFGHFSRPKNQKLFRNVFGPSTSPGRKVRAGG